MSKLFRSLDFVLLAALLLAVVTLSVPVGQAQHPTGADRNGKLGLAAGTTLRAGKHAKLPPHLSTLLGLSKEEECAVMQSVVRTGTLVQGIDVLVANDKDIILFVVDETAGDQSLYLTSPDGNLRKFVAVKAGVGTVARIAEKDKIAFDRQRQFWINRLAPSAAAK